MTSGAIVLMAVMPSETIFVKSMIDWLKLTYCPIFALNAVAVVIQLLAYPLKATN
jgi:hypothetical protein